MVMYLGKVAEIGAAESVFTEPRHPYTRALFSAMPSMDPDRRSEQPPLAGDPPNPIDLAPGCRFKGRCVHAEEVCGRGEIPLTGAGGEHRVACLMSQPGSGHSAAPRKVA